MVGALKGMSNVAAGAGDRCGWWIGLGQTSGIQSGDVEKEKAYHLPAADGSVPVWSKEWLRVKPTTARDWAGWDDSIADERLLENPAFMKSGWQGRWPQDAIYSELCIIGIPFAGRLSVRW